MAKALRALFDEEVLRPEGPVGLRPNTRYLAAIGRQEEEKLTQQKVSYPLTEVLGMASDMGVMDLSARHSWYAHQRLDDDGLGS